jgi:type II secretory pathway component PulJ
MTRASLHAVKRLLTGQRGFTLAETLMGIGITAAIGAALVGSLYQMSNVTSRGADHLAIEADLRTSMQWLAKDLRVAQTTDLVDQAAPVSCAAVAPSPCITLDWTDQYNEAAASHTASYALVGTEVRRTYDSVTHTIARNVAALEVSLNGSLVTVTLTSATGEWADISKQITHYFYLRPLAAGS